MFRRSVDNQEQRFLAVVLKISGLSVMTAANPSEAISVMAKHAIDVAILDYEMPEMNGCMLADQIRARYRDIRNILYSGAFVIPENEITNVDVFVPKAWGGASPLAQVSELRNHEPYRTALCSDDAHSCGPRLIRIRLLPQPCT